MKVVIVGSFDPITIGHKDLIKRVSLAYDEVVVGVGINPDKQCAFSMDERVELINKVISKFNNVTCKKFEGLTVDFATKEEASMIIKGVRNKEDLVYEMKQSCYNKKINPNIVTKFVKADPRYINISSTLIKRLISEGKDVSNLLPNEVKDEIIKKLKK